MELSSADKIMEIMRLTRMNQSELAKRMGVSQQAISSWTHGAAQLHYNYRTIAKIHDQAKRAGSLTIGYWYAKNLRTFSDSVEIVRIDLDKRKLAVLRYGDPKHHPIYNFSVLGRVPDYTS
ncbi:helix-turn-helix domain-containing protein [Phyllobacterium sp. 21LDTY02-6]|uniref:helix-turn-helix domain-containing protein n=1 Tax=Phyllobacterium sp. 21LDTY02-6 TaxID=2944903 RepID=UPI002021262C|nr:helix-turn-helix transcriptional regulator [Phyllobacterium sp. 21LDTY02-6]MCO4316330.1 helix-turn-helix domain-containing protein [Phyllobacterium sp. 21LDTY02-6]